MCTSFILNLIKTQHCGNSCLAHLKVRDIDVQKEKKSTEITLSDTKFRMPVHEEKGLSFYTIYFAFHFTYNGLNSIHIYVELRRLEYEKNLPSKINNIQLLKKF